MWSTEAPSPRNVARKLTGRPDGTDATLIDVLLRVVVALAALTAAVAFASGPHAAPAPPPQYVAPAGSGALFVVSGHGWGHGVGMGQWGAQGYAQQGYTYDQILRAYYPGTTLGETTATSIRVLLADKKKTLTVSSAKSVTVEDGDGIDYTLAAGSTVLTPALKLAVDGGTPQKLTPPLTLTPAQGSLLKLGRRYRGQLVIDVLNGKLRAINVLPLEQYLYGVVPAEMPVRLADGCARGAGGRRTLVRTCEPAGRGAVRRLRGRPQPGLPRRLGRDPGGEGRRRPDRRTGAPLQRDVADTLFSSSTGGRTQSAADAFGAPGRPYLVSVRDPYDTISPYHDWGPVPVTAKTLGQASAWQGTSSTRPSAATRRSASRRSRSRRSSVERRGRPRKPVPRLRPR
jgi:Sporulation protein and related proteins